MDASKIQPITLMPPPGNLLLSLVGMVTLAVLVMLLFLVLDIKRKGLVKGSDSIRKIVTTVSSVVFISICWVYIPDTLKYIRSMPVKNFDVLEMPMYVYLAYLNLTLAIATALTEFEFSSSRSDVK